MQFRSNHGEFEYYARITAISEEAGRQFISLDRSDFFLEGGGQPSDKGSIAGHDILSLQERSGEIWHELETAPELFLGMRVKVVIHREHRLEMSRQHTGQHLLSAILAREYGLMTLGFHVGEETATIDLDGPLEEDALAATAQKVLDSIRADLPVASFIETAEKLQRLGLRKGGDLTGDVQVIRIGDLDISACCGTHLDSTRELLFFIIRKTEKHKDGTRLYFQFGERALAFARDAVRIVQDLKEQLEVHETEIPFRVLLLREEAAEHKAVIQELRDKLLRQMLNSASYQAPLVYQELDEEEELVRNLSAALAKKKVSSLLLDIRGLRIYGTLFKDGVNAGKLFKEYTSPRLRGGGGPTAFQGVADSRAELVECAGRLKDRLEDLIHDRTNDKS